ncbi:hypothetical protein A9R05_44305 (plasmid) [Burkholderia sp. KK1]|uniref:Uncharacterized protein n=1 Tax=Burkholderia sp. M701 TaxID=326454 RepID=V5YNP1_9BURK|nr:hypothetical protein [Burkholderia sp. M701]AQH05977.1 hypothetical protein A9R05_44305 [Burkholderia sp. KK1]BAO19210.1 hypothetical protein [Burkholderia sp. M701]
MTNLVKSMYDPEVLADLAFSEYDFGTGVTVTDSGGWEYTTPGFERTRKVYVETEREDDGPAPRSVLTFTVRFSRSNGSLAEAYAIDEKGNIWGHLPRALDALAASAQSQRSNGKDAVSLMRFRVERLQEVGDFQRISNAVHDCLKSFSASVPEEALEVLIGVLGSIAGRLRGGLDRPTIDEVKASIASSNEFVKEHNAVCPARLKLSLIDITAFPDEALEAIIAGDRLDPAAYLSARCGDAWGECVAFPRSAWCHEAGEGATQLGYWQWVVHQAEERKISLHALTLTQSQG